MRVEEKFDTNPDLFLFNNVVCEDTDVEDLESLDERFTYTYELENYRTLDNMEDKFNVLYDFICNDNESFDFDISELEFYDEYEKIDFVEEYEHLILQSLENSAWYDDFKNHNEYLEHENVIMKNITEEEYLQDEEEWD